MNCKYKIGQSVRVISDERYFAGEIGKIERLAIPPLGAYEVSFNDSNFPNRFEFFEYQLEEYPKPANQLKFKGDPDELLENQDDI